MGFSIWKPQSVDICKLSRLHRRHSPKLSFLLFDHQVLMQTPNHPFVDGNGRTSRLLSTLCLYRSGYNFKRLFSISEYYDRNRTGFYAALQGVRDSDMDLTGWLDYFIEGLATQMDEVTERGKRVIRRDVIAREYALNPRQVLAVGLLLERAELRIEELAALCPGVNRRTLQRDLQSLVRQGVVKSVGAARAVRYKLRIKGL